MDLNWPVVAPQRAQAVVLAIWEGPSRRQILHGLEVRERKRAHHLLLKLLSATVSRSSLQHMEARIDHHVTLPRAEKEGGARRRLANWPHLRQGACLAERRRS